MNTLDSNAQAGFALIIFLVLMMGVGGIVLAGYSQGILKRVEVSKFQHNQRVLQEAKQALLQYAYNYPVDVPGRGPGRLPCPDTDNDGSPNPSFNCISGTPMVGRLPWNNIANINFYDGRDAHDERLWYAVSRNFANTGPPVINSDTLGTITINDQAGNILYDGTAAGVAAIIIAPGPAISRDEDNDGIYEYTQLRGTALEQNDPRNYLDTLNTFDNSVFLNSANTPPDGFILGPVRELDPTSPAVNTVVVNDQMIVITADELTEMAEKATLQTYRTAINSYLTSTGNVYPWLYNYTGVPDVPGLISYYPVDPAGFATELGTNLGSFGRIPSIFGNYFTESDSQGIESRLSVNLPITYPATPTGVGGTGTLLAAGAVAHTFDFTTANRLTDVKFQDIADVVGQDGRLTATATIAEAPFTHEVYFWDDDDGPPTGVWTICPDGAEELEDCHRDAGGNPDPGGANANKEEILRLIIEFEFDPAVNGGVVNFDADYTTPPATAIAAASGAGHATITGTFAGNDLILNTSPLTVRFEIDRHYHAGETGLGQGGDPIETGTLNLADLTPGPLALGIRYYPELPDWAFDNGWHDSVTMAYAFDYRPDQTAPCSEIATPDCIQVNNLAGNNDNKISILVIAGEHDWSDEGADGFTNDLVDVFEGQNAIVDNIFDANPAQGNDKVLIVQECAVAACP